MQSMVEYSESIVELDGSENSTDAWSVHLGCHNQAIEAFLPRKRNGLFFSTTSFVATEATGYWYGTFAWDDQGQRVQDKRTYSYCVMSWCQCNEWLSDLRRLLKMSLEPDFLQKAIFLGCSSQIHYDASQKRPPKSIRKSWRMSTQFP